MPLSAAFSSTSLFLSLCVLTVATSSDIQGLDREYPSSGSNKTLLTLGLMLSFSGIYVDSGAVPGIQLALDIINSEDLLPGYLLQYSLTDSKCDQTVALTQFFEDVVWRSPPKVGFIGGGCENATIETAKISYFFNLTQISCDSSTPEAEDRTRFKRYFQMLPNDIHLSQAFIQILNSFNWTKLHVIELEYGLFVQTVDSLISSLGPTYNITYTSYSNGYHAANSLSTIINKNTIFNTESRIFYLAMYLNDTIRVICEAYHQKKFYPLYVFITLGWHADGWWESDSVNCTSDKMEVVLNRSLAITLDPQIKDANMTTSSGLTLTQYETMRDIRATELNITTQDEEICFDGVWAYALALQNIMQDLESDPSFNRQAATASHLPPNSTFFMENFTYGNDVIMERMFQHLQNTSFVGITGNVSFGPNGIRVPYKIRIQQYRYNDNDRLQRFDIASIPLDLNGLPQAFNFHYGESINTIWPDGVPHDGTVVKDIVGLELPLTVVLYFMAIVGIVLAISCVVFMAVYQNRKFMRLTSPNLNYVLCGGCILLYTSVFFLAIQSTDETISTAVCTIRIWLWAIGYSIAFGPVLGKMFRVYYIFNNPKPNKKKAIKDWMLVVVTCLLASIDVVLLTIVTAIPELRATAILRQSTENPQSVTGDFQDTTIHCIFVCDSEKGYGIWHGVLFGYKAVIQVFAILLAFGTRKVKVKGLNDSAYIAAIIYVTSICLVVVIISFATLRDKVNALAAVYSVGFWFSATTILLLVFVPKFITIYKDPEGKSIFSLTVVQVESDHEKVAVLEKRIHDLQVQLEHEHKVCEDIKRMTLSSSSLLGSVEIIGQHVKDTTSLEHIPPSCETSN